MRFFKAVATGALMNIGVTYCNSFPKVDPFARQLNMVYLATLSFLGALAAGEYEAAGFSIGVSMMAAIQCAVLSLGNETHSTPRYT